MKKKKCDQGMLNEKGITLIALVITVIILLILAGAAVSIGLNGGDVFSRANQAKTEWNAKVEEEDQKLSEALDILDSFDEIKQVNDANPGILEGSGTDADPFTINSIEDLVAFAYAVNKYQFESNQSYMGKKVALGLNLDMQSDKSYKNPNAKYEKDDYGYKQAVSEDSGRPIKQLLTDIAGEGFVPIGNGRQNGFAGTFDGQNHYISNLYEKTSADYSYGGLFGKTTYSINICNLGIKDSNISGYYVGGIISKSSNYAEIRGCYVTGNLSTRNHAGGIIGEIKNGTIANCYNLADINTSSTASGGIVGFHEGISIVNCYNYGNITLTKGSGAGILGVRWKHGINNKLL